MQITETGGSLRSEISTRFPGGGPPVDVISISNVLPRKDAETDGRPFVEKIFDEIQVTTGVRKDSETGLAIGSAFAASPHTVDRLGATAWAAALGTGFDLMETPELSFDIAAPHMVSWLRKGDKGVEFTDPSMWSPAVRAVAAGMQAREMLYLVRTLQAATGEPPVLAQVLGYGDEPGWGRGGASNRMWHMHAGVVNAMQPGGSANREKSADPEAIAALRSPIDRIVFDRYAGAVARIFTNALGGGRDFPEVEPVPDQADQMFSHYKAEFKQAVPLQDVIEAVMQATGPLEDMYTKLRDYHKSFYTSWYAKGYDPSTARTLAKANREAATESLAQFGVTEHEADDMLALVEKLRPTYLQLVGWRAELERQGRRLDGSLLNRRIDRYERFMNGQRRLREPNPILQRMLEDAAHRGPEVDKDREATALASARPSFFFSVPADAYHLRGEGEDQAIYVNKLVLGTCLSTRRMMMEVYARAKLVRG